MKINWFKIQSEVTNKGMNELINFMLSSIAGLNKLHICEFLIYLKQGIFCEDCNKSYLSCECNSCKNCKYDFCLCNMESIIDYFKNLILYNFSNYNIEKIILKIKSRKYGYIHMNRLLDKLSENKLV